MEIIKKYFNLDPVREKQFAALEGLYRSWNDKINVISRKDIDNLYERHVLHSLAIAKAIQFRPGTKVMDAGTGGGFPGIPLAIMFPETEFLLVDSIGKKISVVNAISEELLLKNTRTFQGRAENVKEKFDFIVSRAVTGLPEFYGLVRKLIRKGGNNVISNGILYLKGGDINAEIKELSAYHKVFDLATFFDEEYFLTKKLIHIF